MNNRINSNPMRILLWNHSFSFVSFRHLSKGSLFSFPEFAFTLQARLQHGIPTSSIACNSLFLCLRNIRLLATVSLSALQDFSPLLVQTPSTACNTFIEYPRHFLILLAIPSSLAYNNLPLLQHPPIMHATLSSSAIPFCLACNMFRPCLQQLPRSLVCCLSVFRHLTGHSDEAPLLLQTCQLNFTSSWTGRRGRFAWRSVGGTRCCNLLAVGAASALIASGALVQCALVQLSRKGQSNKAKNRNNDDHLD